VRGGPGCDVISFSNFVWALVLVILRKALSKLFRKLILLPEMGRDNQMLIRAET
jgi:hypothetical protein